MLLKCDEIVKFIRYLCIYRAVVVGKFTSQGGISGCYISNRRGSGWRFNFYLGVKRLKSGLRKCRWAGFRVGKFVRGFDVGIIELGNSIKYSSV